MEWEISGLGSLDGASAHDMIRNAVCTRVCRIRSARPQTQLGGLRVVRCEIGDTFAQRGECDVG